MANRRLFTGYDQNALLQPPTTMTPNARPNTNDEDIMTSYAESPDTMRRRLTPMTGDVVSKPNAIQALLAMLTGEQ
jgi:hypothetical protein